jgi:hypothetical protein
LAASSACGYPSWISCLYSGLQFGCLICLWWSHGSHVCTLAGSLAASSVCGLSPFLRSIS